MPNVNDRSDAVARMAQDWPMIDALVSGTSAMRKAGASFLPKWPDEDQDSYDARLKTATLFPAYRRTLSVMAGKPFSSELQLSDDTPVTIVEWAKDIDREGVSLHVFAAEMFQESFAGLAFILVDAPPQVATPPGRRPSQADQKAAGIRPYWVRIKHNQVLGWKLSTVDGARKITQFRYMECVVEDNGDFASQEIEQVRVLEPGSWRTYRQNDKKEWVLHQQGTTELVVVPIVPVYGSRVGYLDGLPPLRDLAHLNVKHWQSQSDQDTILHAARVPILFAKGFAETEEITVSPWLAVKTMNGEADLKWVEHTGGAIDAGEKSIERLEDQMIQAGAELMVNKSIGRKTATEDANDAEGNRCDLARQTEDFEDSLNQCMALTALYAKQPTGGTVTLFKDFGVSSLTDASATLIQQLAVGGIISDATAINELKRRGELAPEVDPEAEAEAVLAQGPALGTILPPGVQPPPRKTPVAKKPPTGKPA